MSNIQMIHMTFAPHPGVWRKDRFRLHVSDDLRNAGNQLLLRIKSAVGQSQKPHIRDTQQPGRALGFFLAHSRQRLPPKGGILIAVTAIGADQEGDLLAEGDQTGHGGSRTDLNIIRVRADEEIAVKAFQIGKRRGKAQGKLCQAHALRPFRRASSRQISS